MTVSLIDEKPARRIAAEHVMRVTGTLGISGEAARRGIVNLPAVIDRLGNSNFGCSPVLPKAALDRFTAP